MSAVFIRKGGEFGHQHTEGKDREGELGCCSKSRVTEAINGWEESQALP